MSGRLARLTEEQKKKLEELKANGLTDADIENFSEAFGIFDINGDGHISASELKSIIEKCGRSCTEEAAKALIEEEDLDKNGTIDFFEFLYLMKMKVDAEAIQEGNSSENLTTLGEVPIQSVYASACHDIP